MSPSSTQDVAHRAPAWIACICFLALTGGAGAWDCLAPISAPVLTGEELRNDRLRRAAARISDGSAMSLWSDDLDQRSNLRAHLMPFHTGALVRLFGEGTDGVLVGRDGWLFLDSRVERPNHPARDLAGQAARNFSALRRRLAQHGTALHVVPLPRKSVIASEHLPSGMSVHPALELAFARELRRLEVSRTDLHELFRSGPAERLWYREDTHWTPHAQGLAAEAICADTGMLAPPAQRLGRLDRDTPHHDDQSFIRTLGIARNPLAARWLFPPDAHEGPTPRGPDGALLDRRNTDVDARRAAIIGTSFTAGDLLVPLLRHYSGGEFWNGARRGFTVRSTLAHFYGQLPVGTHPRVLVVEYPTFQLYRHQFIKGRLRWNAEELAVYDHLPPARLSALPKGSQLALKNRREATWTYQLSSGKLATRGDGSALVRLAGRPAGDNVRVRMRLDSIEVERAWPRGQDELLLPLIAPRSNQSAVSLVLMGARSAPETVEMVSEFDLGRRTGLSIDAPIERDGRWVQELHLNRPTTLAPHSALALDLHADLPTALTVSVELLHRDPSGKPRACGDLHVSARGFGLLELNLDPAPSVIGLRLTYSAAPASGARRAALVPLALE